MHSGVFLAAGLFILAGCSPSTDPGANDALQRRVNALNDQVDHLTARVAALEASAQTRASAHSYTLTQTWLVPGQPPATSQTAFSSAAACDGARRRALADVAAQADAERAREMAPNPNFHVFQAAAQPTLNAVCSAQCGQCPPIGAMERNNCNAI